MQICCYSITLFKMQRFSLKINGIVLGCDEKCKYKAGVKKPELTKHTGTFLQFRVLFFDHCVAQFHRSRILGVVQIAVVIEIGQVQEIVEHI